MTVVATGGPPGRPQLIRAINEQLILDCVRQAGTVSRTELGRMSGLSKPTVALALTNLERAGLVRAAGVRTGVPGPAASLYEVRPDVGFVLSLDVGGQFLRGAISDVSGAVRVRSAVEAQAANGHGRVDELVRLAEGLRAEAGIDAADVIQTVLGSPGVYNPQRDALGLAGLLPEWDKPIVLTELRQVFGATLMLENDIDAAALAERAHGHGRDVDSFAFISIGTGIGMGLVIGGQLHRGAHGAAGEIGFLPIGGGHGSDAKDARRRGTLEAAASAAGIVRAARRAGLRGRASAREVFACAGNGDERAVNVVSDEAKLIAQAICAVVAIADPELIVLGGGVGQAAGFLEAVAREVRRTAPVQPELKVSALGADAVVDGCLAAGIDRAWNRLMAALLPDVGEPLERGHAPAAAVPPT